MKPGAPRLFWQTFVASSVLWSVLAFYQTYARIESLDIALWRSRWVLLLGAYVLNVAAGIRVFVLIGRDPRGHLIERFDAQPRGLPVKIFSVLLVASGILIIWFVRWNILYPVLPDIFPAFWLFWWSSLLAALGIRWYLRASWTTAFAIVLLLQGVLFVAYGRLRFVTDYPFSIGYSEASRYYYASLPFARSLYGMPVPLSPWHPSRYFLLGVPFFFPGTTVGGERLWQAALWISLTAFAAYALVRRLHLDRTLALATAAWFFVYSFQGMVYYHLQVMVLIILLGVSPKHAWRSLPAILLASLWAGVSRVNWFPVPAMLAIALYLLEVPFDRTVGWARYLQIPLLWGVLGTATAFLSQAGYVLWSGNADHPEFFRSSFSSPLLWNRLWPNPSNPLGILPGIFLVSSPLWMVIYNAVQHKAARVHWIRWTGLAGLGCVLFAGGAVVSTKIGGGAELHNMDAYMVILALTAAYLFASRIAADKGNPVAWGKAGWPVLCLALTVPLLFAINNITPYGLYDRPAAEKNLQTLQTLASGAVAGEGQVLFITERQLLTYHMIQGVPLVPDYELVTLMEMAMSKNMDYLDRFYADLHHHRFALIVARRQNTGVQSDEEGFADENNAWNTLIAAPLLCEYEPVMALEKVNVQVFAPRRAPQTCP